MEMDLLLDGFATIRTHARHYFTKLEFFRNNSMITTMMAALLAR